MHPLRWIELAWLRALGAAGEYHAQHTLSEMHLVGCCVERPRALVWACRALEASKSLAPSSFEICERKEMVTIDLFEEKNVNMVCVSFFKACVLRQCCASKGG